MSEKLSIKVVLWEEVEASNLTVHLEGENGILLSNSKIEKLEDFISRKIVNKQEANALYQFPMMFNTEGEWKVTLKEGEDIIGSFVINVSQ
ncbi:hypothetical protein FZW96_03260 [Bacillus sp. BGMRC 2118]|nr:hypothetical protein FZW96_03260 [Bacillus sp. BGMRC 2118]